MMTVVYRLVLVWLTPVMTVNILVFNLGEENKLLKEFGAAYPEYYQHIPILVQQFPSRK